ncbi:alpha/beta fold hydrolase [Salinarimonas soli]|uniref:Alpha/beta fold hydrolase n=1 Tax=Salinarimonas soli TaxID=1638099 RepID=A0A5B2VWM9_9HYPH|nr:alpha/beta fold hydrolase [Salinarimonas soli]KAA2244243.1 alpha/beta fold hydrolase [Salinarimonas soli]
MRAPLVLLPGMMCDARLFAPQVSALSDVAEPWVGDIGGADSIEALAGDILARAPFDRFALAGLSMGGIVAMAILRAAPERVERLALLDTNHRAETPERRALRGPQIERARAGELRVLLVDEMKPAYLGPAHRADAGLLDLILAMGLDLGPAIFERQSVALRDRPDATEALRAYGGPSLVLCGRHDALCPPERHAEIAGLLGNARLTVIEGAGHLPTLEEPEAVTSALRLWLAR